MKVLVESRTFVSSIAAIEKLKAAGFTIVTPDPPGDSLGTSGLEQLAKDAEAIVVGHGRVGRQVIQGAAKLRIIAKQGVGVDNIDLDSATECGVWVTTTHGYNAESVADLTFALILATSRRLVEAHNLIAGGGWARIMGTEVYGKNLGILGFGDIGRRIARRALGFSMSIAYHDIVRAPNAEAELKIRYLERDELLAWSDYLSIHVPLSPATRNLIGEREIALMKASAYLINVSRGGVVDETALRQALVAGRLAGAGLDVFAAEPLNDLSLAGLPNVVATPHMGAYTREAVERVSCAVADSIIAALAGKAPPNAVNQPQGAIHGRGGN
jgi:D-3-phosphoglycerate dehydrogenase